MRVHGWFGDVGLCNFRIIEYSKIEFVGLINERRRREVACVYKEEVREQNRWLWLYC